jgi:CRP-like cAMP-binding protein
MPFQSQPNLSRFVDRLSSRSILTDEERQAVLTLPSEAAQVPVHRDIVRLGEVVDHSCFVVEGMVGRFGQNTEGERQITALHIPGDMPDLHSVVSPRAASALQALSTTTFLRVPHRALRSVAARYPAIAEAFWRDCVADAAIMSEWIVNVGCRDAKARIAHLLCELALRYGIDVHAADAAFPFPITQEHIGYATGLTAVHVNRTLKALKDSGAVSLGGRAVRVLDWDALVRLGEFDGTYLHVGDPPEPRLRIVEAA